MTAQRTAAVPETPLDAYWSHRTDDVVRALRTTVTGLSSDEARVRLQDHGPNQLRDHKALTALVALGRQFESPLVLLLVFAAALSAISGEWVDSALVFVIVLATASIGWSREYRAGVLAEALRRRVQTRARVLRNGAEVFVPAVEVVPGDVVQLVAGGLVPADGLLLEATDLFVNEATLTGESFPVEKRPGIAAPEAPLGARSNCVFLGTNVRAGTGRSVIVSTGQHTQYGLIARRLVLRPPETDFDRGVRHFGYLLSTAMLVMVVLLFVGHVLRGRPPAETLLFAVALAVGLSPELLPAILTVNLARAAALMAERGVLVRRLNAIENLGAIDVLCTDKTGTITEGVVQLDGVHEALGGLSDRVLTLACINAALSTGIVNPLNDALLSAMPPGLFTPPKAAEIPFDHLRRCASVVTFNGDGTVTLVTKGAFTQIVEACDRVHDGRCLDHAIREQLERRYEEWAGEGVRVLAVATRILPAQDTYSRDDEQHMVFEGFVTFVDHPQRGVDEAIVALGSRGVAVKIITGDNVLVARHVASLVGLSVRNTLTGGDLRAMSDSALWHQAEQVDVFAEVDPSQKERIILALKATGHVVGFLGDGVNDAPAMHAADTSLAVDQAVDVARDTADFVLLERGLDVIRRGLDAGRDTFANTLKYILITTSANLGNMISMAAASFVLPFLPLTAGQVLLNNFLSDIPAVGLAGDRVDRELVARPRRWSMRYIARHMVTFGLVSSAFDLLTFAALLVGFGVTEALFRTAWFVESLLTELLVALVLRTRGPVFGSRPGALLLWSTAALVVVALALPLTQLFGLVPIPWSLLWTIVAIAVLYVIATEWTKRHFYHQAPAARW